MVEIAKTMWTGELCYHVTCMLCKLIWATVLLKFFIYIMYMYNVKCAGTASGVELLCESHQGIPELFAHCLPLQ